MSAKIDVAIKQLEIPVFGRMEIDILVDGTKIFTLELGESAAIEVSPGRHLVQAVLNASCFGLNVQRKSKVMEISCDDESAVKVLGRYSRLWGNVELQYA